MNKLTLGWMYTGLFKTRFGAFDKKYKYFAGFTMPIFYVIIINILNKYCDINAAVYRDESVLNDLEIVNLCGNTYR
ncbi:hypothetical protein BEL04_14475 [Mucilaginibacter sp. PPCGB 2223]|nr:hypothetical protein BEL04_14475 [Mucilaginibacter sp. PPCGB 2223]